MIGNLVLGEMTKDSDTRMKRRAIDEDGRSSNNPLLDSRKYKAEYTDGTTEALVANTIAENRLRGLSFTEGSERDLPISGGRSCCKSSKHLERTHKYGVKFSQKI